MASPAALGRRLHVDDLELDLARAKNRCPGFHSPGGSELRNEPGSAGSPPSSTNKQRKPVMQLRESGIGALPGAHSGLGCRSGAGS